MILHKDQRRRLDNKLVDNNADTLTLATTNVKEDFDKVGDLVKERLILRKSLMRTFWHNIIRLCDGL